jgi:hypothetical protein
MPILEMKKARQLLSPGSLGASPVVERNARGLPDAFNHYFDSGSFGSPFLCLGVDLLSSSLYTFKHTAPYTYSTPLLLK